jgi:PPOX class probable F420-dependent enzyme
MIDPATTTPTGGFMPQLPLPEPIREMLRRPNPAVMATVRKHGQPVTVPTWYLLDDDQIVVNLDAGRRRLQHLRNDPRVSLSVLDADDWYSHVSVIGEVSSITDDVDLAGIDRQSMAYQGKPYPNRTSPRVDVRIEIRRWHSWGELKKFSQPDRH